MKVAEQLSARDRLGAHMRDEPGSTSQLSRVPCRRRGYPPQALRSSLWFLLRASSSRLRPAYPLIAALSLVSLAALGRSAAISEVRRWRERRCGSHSEAPWRWQ